MPRSNPVNWVDVIKDVDLVLSICYKIYKMAKNAKANKERCQHIAQKVKSLEEMVLTIKERRPSQISSIVKNTLRELCATMEEAQMLITNFCQTKPFMAFLKSGNNEEKFYKVDKRLNDNLHLLSTALHIEQGNMLQKVYDTVKGKRHGRTRTTTSTPLSSTMFPEPVSSPTTPTPSSSITSSMPASSPTTPTPFSYIMSSMPASNPTPFSCFMSSMPASSPMLLCGNNGFSTTIISQPATMSVISSPTTANIPAISINNPMNYFSTQNTILF